MKDKLEEQLQRFEELERQLADPDFMERLGNPAALFRERGSLAKVATKYRRFKDLNRQISEALEMSHAADSELRELAETELPGLRVEREEVWNELLDLTIGGEDANRSRCIVEIRAGTGGDEAALFARDLYEMYKHYAADLGWKVEVLELNSTELGGFKEVILGMEGEGVYRDMQYESGVHRVQRVPETEAKGRVHTSTATVAVMPEPEDVEVDVKPEDYRKDLFCASGPGGQHVNKTESAVRLTHHATGIVVSCQDEKSQHKNFARALRVLKSRIYELKRQEEHDRRASERRGMVGSGDRSEKIRTYNFPENRLTDHRINLSLYQLSNILAGALGPVTEALRDYDRRQQRSMMGTVE
jgi:peptide chain release factor 1